MANPVPLLERRLRAAIGAALGPDVADADPVLRRSQQPRFGDYQANGAMALGQRLGRPPREVAGAIVASLDAADLLDKVEVAGPGFLNLTLRDDVLGLAADALAADERLGVAPAARPRKVVLDYSSPNLAKEMHVGHLRSTIIGDALARVLEFLGHRVVRQNHFGDWGTQFGMLVEHLSEMDDGGARTIADLDELYRQASARFQSEPEFAERARQRVVALQAGDPATLAVWRALVAESKGHAEAVYRRLNVTLDGTDIRGESFYNPMLADVAAELEAAGLARVDDGALCVFPPGFTGRDGEALPVIVRKADGGFGYAATDLAAIRFRVGELGGERLAYVVDARQAQHFAMVFAVARMAGWLPEGVAAEHVTFGTMLGDDGRPFRTRSGGTVRLTDLLDEAEQRAAALVAGNAELDDEARSAVARAVGVGAVKYYDLANDRAKDYVFAFDRMLALEGNTAPYLQYASARIRSILRRAGEAGEGAGPGPVVVGEPAERELVLQLLGLDAVVHAAADTMQPHRLCTYLFGLASAFTTFYETCPVLRAPDEPTRASRLSLSARTAETLALGLGLLGIGVPERM